jgi:hypothetical protein
MVREGGLTVDTRLSDDPAAPIALQSVIQIDGDRTIMVDLDAMASLSMAGRLQLHANHCKAVTDLGLETLVRFGRGAALARTLLLPAFGLGEILDLAHAVIRPHGLAWRDIALEQGWLWSLVAARLLMPVVLRLLHREERQLLQEAARAASRIAHLQLVRSGAAR